MLHFVLFARLVNLLPVSTFGLTTTAFKLSGSNLIKHKPFMKFLLLLISLIPLSCLPQSIEDEAKISAQRLIDSKVTDSVLVLNSESVGYSIEAIDSCGLCFFDTYSYVFWKKDTQLLFKRIDCCGSTKPLKVDEKLWDEFAYNSKKIFDIDFENEVWYSHFIRKKITLITNDNLFENEIYHYYFSDDNPDKDFNLTVPAKLFWDRFEILIKK